MRHHGLFIFPLLLALASCATHDPGWRGTRAESFDGAKTACEAEAAAVDAGGRDAAFEACMARRGWTR